MGRERARVGAYAYGRQTELRRFKTLKLQAQLDCGRLEQLLVDHGAAQSYETENSSHGQFLKGMLTQPDVESISRYL